MDVILHIGAHRTASTSFQAYMRANADQLANLGIGFWGPHRTRNGVLSGVLARPGPVSAERQFRLASGRLALACEKAARSGIRQLVVSDENILGAPRRNLRADTLYPGAVAHIARHIAAFGGGVTRIVLSIRSPELYWASCFAFALARGHALPDAARLARLVAAPRSWREVIADIARAAPGVDLMVMTHEDLGGLPERRLWQMTEQRLMPPQTHARAWLNRSPDLAELRAILRDRGADPSALPAGEGRWMPFGPLDQAQLRETYADDLFWLRAGADGLARLVEDRLDEAQLTEHQQNFMGQAGPNPPPDDRTRGRHDDKQTGRMVSHR